MFSIFKNKKPNQIIVAIHGFGKRQSIEFDNLINNMSEYDFIIPNLYDLNNEDDNNINDWIAKAEQALLEASRLRRPIILIGFSMGGVIASHLATRFKIDKLILIAPAFEYLTIKTASSAISNAISKPNDEEVEIPKTFTTTFRNIVDRYKDNIYDVECPILMLHASCDEVIPASLTNKIFNKLKNTNKKCFILLGGQHRILDDALLSKSTIFLIRNYIENNY